MSAIKLLGNGEKIMKAKKLTKKLLSLILSVLMVITVIPASIIPSFAESDSDTLLEVGEISYSGWTTGTYNEYSVKTNGTDGDIIIVFTPQNNNWSSAGNNLLSINGVSVIAHGGTAGSYKLGSTDVAANFTARVITVTVNVTTGDATIVDTAGNSGTANVGAIGETFTLKINQDSTNSWTLTSLVVTQAKGASGDSSDTGALLEVGRIAYASWSNGTKNEYTVETNKTGGDITIVFTPERNNWYSDGNNLLSVNGVSLIKTYGVSGSYNGYYLGTTAVKTSVANVITVVINPTTGAASISDVAGNTGTANVGAIGDSFTMIVNQDQNNGWELTSIVVTQAKEASGETHVCEYTTTVKEATCTTPEVTVKECLECGDSTETATAPVLGHTWGAWSKSNGVATRSCTVCDYSQSKTVGAADNSKNLLAIGDSLTYGVNVENTINGSWARYVSDNFGMKAYHNFAVHGTEVYEWYSLLTGNAAPNEETSTEIGGLTRDALIEEVRNAGIVAFSLGSNDLIGGYVGHRSAEKVHETLIKIVDEIHAINPDAIVVSVGYAYGIAMNEGGKHETSYQLLIDFNNLMTETLNSEAYNSFAYHVDVSNVMSDVLLMGTDTVHPTAEGHRVIADRVNLALESLDKADKVTWENVSSYVNHFDGTAPAAAVVAWGETGKDGVLTVAPSADTNAKNANTLNVGSVAFPGKTVVTFKFNIPQLPESGSINIFHDRGAWQSYVCVFSQVNEETQETEFFASVGNKNEGNSVVKIEGNTWYDVTILFAEDASAYSRVYIGNTFIGTVKGDIIGRTAGWGFANFSGCSGAGEQNAAAYQIDDFTASTVADDTLVHAYGIQRSEPSDLLYDVRFILSVADIYNDESAIGMDITVNYGDESRTKTGLEVKTVFEGFFENYGEDIVSADDLGGQYIAAIVVEDIPVEYECVEFVVSPYALVDGVKYYSKTMTATVYSKK